MILQGEWPPEAKNWAFEPVKLRWSPPQAKFSDFRSPKWAICKGNLPKTDPIFTGFRFEGGGPGEIPSLNVNLCKIIIVGFKTHLKDFTIAFKGT